MISLQYAKQWLDSTWLWEAFHNRWPVANIAIFKIWFLHRRILNSYVFLADDVVFFKPEPWIEPELEIAIDTVTKAPTFLALRVKSIIVRKVVTSFIYFGNKRSDFFSDINIKKIQLNLTFHSLKLAVSVRISLEFLQVPRNVQSLINAWSVVSQKLRASIAAAERIQVLGRRRR